MKKDLYGLVRTYALRGGDGEISPDGGLTFLIDHLQFALDQFLAVAFGLAGHLAAHCERIAGPYLACETDAELAHLAGARVVGETSRETSCRPHPLRKDGRDSGRLDESLVVMERNEVTRRTRVADEVGARDIFNNYRRNLVANFHCVVFYFRCHCNLDSAGRGPPINAQYAQNYASGLWRDFYPPTAWPVSISVERAIATFSPFWFLY